MNALPDPPGLVGRAALSPQALARPMLGYRITCGFPSPAEDFMGEELDLNKRCIANPVATFYVEADTGTSMVDFGIFPGDTLIVDRSITPRDGDVVMVLWEGGYMCKQLRIRGQRFELRSGHPDHPPLLVPPEMELDIWGVITWSFRKQFRRSEHRLTP